MGHSVAHGKKRGTVNLSKYIDQVYAKMSTARLEDDLLWCEELFVNKFKSLRGWSQAHAVAKFKELKASPKSIQTKVAWVVPPELLCCQVGQVRTGRGQAARLASRRCWREILVPCPSPTH